MYDACPGVTYTSEPSQNDVMTMYRYFVFLMMALIALSLFSALYHLFKGDDKNNRMVKALSWRVGLSITLFLILAGVQYFFGINPRG